MLWAAGTANEASLVACNHAARRYVGQVQIPFDGRLANPVEYAISGGASVDVVDGHDGHQLCKGHASLALLPGLLAEHQLRPETSLNEALVDFILGTEIALRAGMALNATAADYHSSGAWNALGCAAIFD